MVGEFIWPQLIYISNHQYKLLNLSAYIFRSKNLFCNFAFLFFLFEGNFLENMQSLYCKMSIIFVLFTFRFAFNQETLNTCTNLSRRKKVFE